MLKAALIICLTVCISAKDDEKKDGLYSWSNLSFQSSNSEGTKDVEDMVGSESEVYSQEIQPDVDSSSPEGRANPRQRRRKNRFRNRRPAYEYNDYVDNQIDDNYIDRDSGYSAPTSSYNPPSSSYSAPDTSYDAPSYSAPSYEAPAPSYSAPSYSAPSYSGTDRSLAMTMDYQDDRVDNNTSFLSRALRFFGYDLNSSASSYQGRLQDYSYDYDEYSAGGKDTFNDFLNALAAFLPIGLFLAAIPPNLIVINSTRRKRGVEMEVDYNNLDSNYSFPFMKKIGSLGYTGLQSVECQRRLLCEMATYGASEGANSVQKSLAYIATLTPRPIAQYLSADDVFQAVRDERCEQFHCSAF